MSYTLLELQQLGIADDLCRFNYLYIYFPLHILTGRPKVLCSPFDAGLKRVYLNTARRSFKLQFVH